ncbi:unnamed protein product [Schistosoma turkestanicum]|nr:unnamed protein product [Schistosoma turkestanicum]
MFLALGYCMKLAIQESLHNFEQSIQLSTRLSNTSYENFAEMVSHLNQLCISTFGEKCSFVKFFVKKQPQNLFWRFSTKVFCRISEKNRSVYRTFELIEFLRLYDKIVHFKSMIDSQPQMNVTSEMSDDPCCICFDREPDTVLACMHAFCQPCIYKWARIGYKLPSERSESSTGQASSSCQPSDSNRSQCPICRSTCTNISTSWALIGVQLPKNHLHQISGIVFRLISRTGRPSDTFPEVGDDDGNDRREETTHTVIGHKHNPT